MMKKHRLIKIIIGFFVIICILGLGVGNYFYDLALNPKTDKSVVFNSENNQFDGQKSDTKIVDNYFKDNKVKEVYTQSNDDLKLHSYYLKNKNNHKYALIFHGYMANAKAMFSTGYAFNHLDYNVLIPDARGHGLSQGDYIGMGWDDRKDVVSWIDYIIKQDQEAQIVLYGISMGGATVMMVSGEQLASNVKAIVEDCGYSDVMGIFSYQLKQIFNLPSFPIMNFSSAVAKVRAGYFLEDANAIKQLEKAKTPILFIHGDQDTFVPFTMLDQVYNAAKVEKKKIVVKGAGHGESSLKLGATKYWQEVDSFISKYIK